MIYTNDQGFAGILQLRPANKKLLDFVYNELKKRGNVFITKEVELKTGVDLYLTSSVFTKALGQMLKKKFGGSVKLSRSLFGYDKVKSKKVYRLTVCFRLD